MEPRPDVAIIQAARGSPETALRSIAGRLGEVTRSNWMLLLSCAAILCFLVRPPLAAHLHRGATALLMIAILLSATLSNIGGFAFTAIASVSVVHLVKDPVEAVKVILVASIALQSYSVFMLRHTIDWRTVMPFLFGGLCFMPVGIHLLVSASIDAYWKGLGAFIVLYAVAMMLRRDRQSFRGHVLIDVAVGGLGGITGGAAGFPAAFLTVWCSVRGWDKNRQRAVYQPFILAMQLATLVGIAASGRLGSNDMLLLQYVPAALLGGSCGLAIFRRLTDRQFSVAICALLIASGAGLLFR